MASSIRNDKTAGNMRDSCPNKTMINQLNVWRLKCTLPLTWKCFHTFCFFPLGFFKKILRCDEWTRDLTAKHWNVSAFLWAFGRVRIFYAKTFKRFSIKKIDITNILAKFLCKHHSLAIKMENHVNHSENFLEWKSAEIFVRRNTKNNLNECRPKKNIER